MAGAAGGRAEVSLRIDLDGGGRIGPGKIALLEAMIETGSISAAGRRLGMSYRRAWLLADALNGMFEAPVVTTSAGGAHGGGAAVTDFGQRLIAGFRAAERAAAAAVDAEMGKALAALRPRGAAEGGGADGPAS